MGEGAAALDQERQGQRAGKWGRGRVGVAGRGAGSMGLELALYQELCDPGFSLAPLWEYFFRYAMGGNILCWTTVWI